MHRRFVAGSLCAAFLAVWLTGEAVGQTAHADSAADAASASARDGLDTAGRIAARRGSTAKVDKPSAPFILAPGIDLTINYTGEGATNPNGGLRRGAAYAGQWFLGADFDLMKLADIPGGSMHFVMIQRHGESLALTSIGNNTSVQNIYGRQRNLHLAILTYEQRLLNDQLDFVIGRTVANVAFLTSPIYCNFQTNTACASPTFILKDSNFTSFPASSWGAHARYYFTDTIYAHVGAYEVNPADKTPTTNGFDFSVERATGVTIPYEVGYGTSFTNDRLPRHYQLGGCFDPSDYADPYLDANGRPAVLTGEPYATPFYRSGLFARFDQMIWRPQPDAQRGLTLFGVAMTSIAGRVAEDAYFELGLLLQGTFPGRDQDTIGLLAGEQRFSNAFLSNIRAGRISAGGNGRIPHNEIMMELNYGYQVHPAARIMPNLQYIINPDQTSIPFRSRDIPDAFVIGLKFTVDISRLMNTYMARSEF